MARLLICPALLGISGYSIFEWTLTFLSRRFGMLVPQVGVALGLVHAIDGVLARCQSGVLSDRCVRTGAPASRLRVTLVAWAIVLPCSALWTMVLYPSLSLALVSIAMLGTGLGQSAAPACIQAVMPNAMRG